MQLLDRTKKMKKRLQNFLHFSIFTAKYTKSKFIRKRDLQYDMQISRDRSLDFWICSANASNDENYRGNYWYNLTVADEGKNKRRGKAAKETLCEYGEFFI